MQFNWQLILTYEDYKTLCGKLKIGDKIKHKGWSNVTTIDIIGDNMCLEPREKIYVSCEVAIHEENVDWKATYYANLKGDKTMKRIDIRKDYKDENIGISFADDNPTMWTIIRIIRNNLILLNMNVGEGFMNIDEANTILAPFGYELYESTDWTKVEVGTKLIFSAEGIKLQIKRKGCKVKVKVLELSEEFDSIENDEFALYKANLYTSIYLHSLAVYEVGDKIKHTFGTEQEAIDWVDGLFSLRGE